MNKSFIRLYAVFCSLVIIGTLLFFGFKVVNSSKQNLIEAEKNFKYIARYISSNSETQDITSNAFLTEVKNLCEISGNIETASLVNKNNVSVFLWKKDSYDENAETSVHSSFVFKPYSISLNLKRADSNESSVYTFKAVLRTLSSSLVITYLRDCLLIFILLLVITILFIIVHYILNLSPKEKSEKLSTVPVYMSEEPSLKIKPSTQELNIVEPKREYTLKDLEDVNFGFDKKGLSTYGSHTLSEGFSSLEPQEKAGSKENLAKTMPNDLNSQLDTTLLKSTSLNVNATAEPRELSNQVGESELEVFCNETGLEEKLAYELGRATSSEQDISLIIMRILKATSSELKTISKLIFEYFGIKEMLFTFGDDGFAIIAHDADLEHTMEHAEKLYKKITQSLTSKEIGIGITTRSARLISETRLIDEAYSAVEKAFERADTPIVAFRPDPKAYKDFIRDYT